MFQNESHQRGQGGVEYALLLAGISLVIIVVSGALFTAVQSQLRDVLCEMDSNGRVQYECNEGVEPGYPIANFEVTCTGLICAVDAALSRDTNPDGTGTITSYNWDFGDSTSGTGETTSRIYAADGTYTITLTVTDDDLHTGSTAKTVSVETPNNAPTASFTVSCSDLTCTFNAAASSDSDGSIVSYEWNFGDGATGTTVAATHAYTTSGSRTVTLKVTDNLGKASTTTHTATATMPPALVIHITDLDATTTTSGNNWTATITITVKNALDQAMSGVSVAGNFNNGGGSGTCTTNASGQCSITSASVASNGGNAVTSLTFTTSNLTGTSMAYNSAANTDPDGDSNGTVIAITSSGNALPIASFTVSCTNLTCAFNATASTDSDGTISTYAWNFGDSSTGTGAAASRTYTSSGIYTVTLTVTDNAGGTGTSTQSASPVVSGTQIWISDVDATGTVGSGNKWTLNTLTFHVRDGSGNNVSGAIINLTDATPYSTSCTTDSSGNCTTSGHSVLLGNSSATTSVTINSVAVSGATYQASSNTNTDGDGHSISSNTITIINASSNALPTASFTVTCTSLTCAFNASASSDSDGTISTYAWNFGDSSTGTGATTSRIYAVAGTYTVTLTVTDNAGGTGTATHSASPIVNASPVASFTVSCTNLVCSFNAGASSDSDGTINTYAWNFGDSTTSSGVTTSRTYTAAGTYTVTLTVTDNLGATGSANQSASPTAAAVTQVWIDDVDAAGTDGSNGSKWTLNTITFHVRNNNGSSVSGAVISVTNATPYTTSCTTDSTGSCTTSGHNVLLNNSHDTTTVTINSVTVSGVTYQASSNTNTDGDGHSISSNSITIDNPR